MKNQNGNVVFILLVAVGLFAALSTAIFSGVGAVNDNRDKDELRLQATELIQYGAKVRRTIERLQAINGCSDNQLSFENPQVDNATIWNYANPREPADGRCHVFGKNGGQISYFVLPDTFIGKETDASSPYAGSFAKAAYPLFSATTSYEAPDGTGHKAEIMMIISFLDGALCDAINAERDVETGHVVDLFFNHPLGPYVTRGPAEFTDGLEPPAGSPPWGCGLNETYGYQFYTVLDFNPD